MVSSGVCRKRPRSWVGEISEVTSWLFLSGARAVRPNRLKEIGITCVVNVTTELPEVQLDSIEVIAAKINDSQIESLHPCLHGIVDKLRSVKINDGKVLVHCIAGVSRSPTIVLAYLVKHESLSLRDAFFRLRDIRPVVRPNTNFFKQLIEFEEDVRGRRSINIIEVPDSNIFIPDVCEDELKMVQSRSWTQMIKARRNIHNQFA